MLVYLDTETTGFKASRLIEIAYKVDGEDPRGLRCKPPIPIEPDAIPVHGITDEMLAMHQPFNEHPDYARMKREIEQGVVVAHNAPFDIAVLEREGIHVEAYIDTKQIARALYPAATDHKLQNLRNYLQIPGEYSSHSALGDVLLLIEICKKMRADMMAAGMSGNLLSWTKKRGT